MLMNTLEAIFKPEGIAYLKELDSEYKVAHASERHHMIEVCSGLLDLISKELVRAPEHLREVLGCEFNTYTEEDEMKTRRRWFGGITHRTRSLYSSRLADAIILMGIMVDATVRDQANISLDDDSLRTLTEFNESERDMFSLMDLISGLLNTNSGITGNYNNDPLCLYPVINILCRENVSMANKACSSLKFVCRGVSLLKLLELSGNHTLSESSIVKNLETGIGRYNSFANLNRLHKGICSMDSKVTSTVVLRDGKQIFVDGLDFAPEKIGNAARRVLRVVNRGFQSSADPLTKRGAQAVIKAARMFEDNSLCLFHLLMGATSRATDYKLLKIQDVKVLDNDVTVIYRLSNKTSLLRREAVETPCVLPTRHIKKVLEYWNIHRCQVIQAAKTLGVDATAWKTKCFVYSDADKVRTLINKCLTPDLGESAKFQRLRHAAQAMFRHYVAPRELRLREAFSYDSLFGHTYKTGLSYGLQVRYENWGLQFNRVIT